MADEVVIEDRVEKGGDKREELTGGIEELEKKRRELKRDNRELKEKVERLSREIEELRSMEAEMKQRIGEMEVEMEQFEEEKKVLESLSARAVELESEVVRIQEDLVNSSSAGDETAAEVAELKKGLTEKGERSESYEKEAESLRRERAETDKRFRDLERKIGVLEVRGTEQKSKKLRVEEEMREKANHKDQEINELQRKVADLKMELVKDVGEVDHCNSEKKRTEEALSVSQKREMEKELKKAELLKKAEEAKNTLAVLNERIMEPANGVTATKDVASDGDQKKILEGQLQWPVVAAGSVGAIGLVAATVFCMLFKTNVIR